MDDVTAMSVTQLRAELAGQVEARKEHTGALKGAFTKRIKALESELATRQPPVLQDPEPEPGSEPVKVTGLRIHDSDLFDGVRYSITTDGRVWRPDGEQRLGEVVGLVSREVKVVDGVTVQTGFWVAERDDSTVGRDRSRRKALQPLVATA
jgi:hypothetical protein